MNVKRLWKKPTALLLVFIITCNLFAASAAEITSAQEANTEESGSYTLEELPKNLLGLIEDQTEAVSVVKDDELYSLTTNNEDGSNTAIVFAVPVKYQDQDGETQLIDTSIVSNGLLTRSFGGYQYKNKANAFVAEFSTDMENGIRLSSEEGKVVMAPQKPVTSAVTAQALTPSDSALSASVTASIEESSGTGDDLYDAFVYQNAFGEGTTLKYYNTYTGIKEDIILEENTGINRFDFIIDTHGDTPALTDDQGMILIKDKDDPEHIIYTLGNLYAYDSYTLPADSSEPVTEPAAEEALTEPFSESEEPVAPPEGEPPFDHICYDCRYELEALEDSCYRVTVVVSEEWLNHPDVVYPVTIDPTINATSSATNIDDTYVRESAPNSNYYLENRLRIGNYNGTDYTSGRCYTFLRFYNLPSIPSNASVTDATLTLHLLSGQTTAQNARAWRVTSSWNGSSLTWNNHPSNGESTPYSYSSNNVTKYNMSVGAMVNKWYSGTANYGFLINYANERYHDLNSLYSSDCGLADKLPKMQIAYEYFAKPLADGVYYIRSKYSGKYLDVNGQYTSSGTNVHQWAYHGGPSQQWQVTYLNNGYYRISPMHASDKALDVYDAGSASGTNVQIYQYNGTAAQQWRPVKYSDGSYRLTPRCTISTIVLDVNGPSTANGANVSIYTRNDNSNQQFYFEKVDYGVAWSFNALGNGHKTDYKFINCYLYALGISTRPVGQNPTDGLSMNYGDSVDTVAQRVLANVRSRGRSIRIISGPTAPINSNEYRFCMRVGNHSDYIHTHDYHFWVQTRTGEWADKHGWFSAAVNEGFVNPSTATTWDLDNYDDYYNSKTIYFAATRS